MNIMQIFDDIIDGISSFSDEAYKEGWLWYLLIGLVVLFVIIIFYN